MDSRQWEILCQTVWHTLKGWLCIHCLSVLLQRGITVTRCRNWTHSSVRASIYFCPSPLCCSVNGQWDDGACGALFWEDRYALMHQQLQVLLKMSAYAHTYIQSRVWKPSGGKVCRPQQKHAYRQAVRLEPWGTEMCTGWLIWLTYELSHPLWRRASTSKGNDNIQQLATVLNVTLKLNTLNKWGFDYLTLRSVEN